MLFPIVGGTSNVPSLRARNSEYVGAHRGKRPHYQNENRRQFVEASVDESMEVSPEQRIWMELGRLRVERGVSPGFMAQKLGVDPSLLRRMEGGEMKGLNLERLSIYLAALRLRAQIILPEGKLILQPVELSYEQPKITTAIFEIR